MKVPLSAPTVTEEMKESVLKVMDSGRFVKGPMVREFENQFSRYCGTKFGVGVNSGTSALYISIKALGINQGDEVLLPSHSFVATATPVLMAGGKPVFVDIGEDYLMDMDDLEKKITDRTKAIICVHLYGQMCDMKRLNEIKEKHNLYLIEDACQAHGAEYEGRRAGSFGDISCFSFFPSKNMTVCGDGGMAVTSSSDYEGVMRSIRDQGRDYGTPEGKFKSSIPGMNFRMSEISGAIGTEQLKNVEKWIERRRQIASVYDRLLPDEVKKPIMYENRKHVFHLYVIRTERRDELRKFLMEKGIETGIHYPLPIHSQPLFQGNWNLPNTDRITREVLSLPIFPTMEKEQAEFVCEKVNEFFR